MCVDRAEWVLLGDTEVEQSQNVDDSSHARSHQIQIRNKGCLCLSTRKTPGESDLGGAVQCGSRIETAREPTTRSLLLSVPAMVR
jgi:hypothetical protein